MSAPEAEGRARPSALALAAVVALCVAHAALYRGYVNDDAYITFRYSRFLASGQGPYFNPGEHVEGYTNFLLMLLVAAAVAAVGPGAAVPAAKAIGLAAGGACAALAFLLARLVARRSGVPEAAGVAAAFAAGLLVAGCEAFALNSASGLETSLFAALLALGVLLGLLELERGRWLGSGLAFAGACLTRPEGPLLFGCFWVAAALLASRPAAPAPGAEPAAPAAEPERPVAPGASMQPSSRLRALSRPLRPLVLDGLVVGLVVLAHLAFRVIAYDGEWLPNTFYAKLGGSGQVSAWGYVRGGAVLPFLGLPGLAAALAGLLLPRRVARIAAPVSAVAVVTALLPFATGPDWMPGWRLVMPAVPLLAALVAVGWGMLAPRFTRRAAAAVVLPPLAALAAFLGQAQAREVFHTIVEARAIGLETAHGALAVWLRRAARPGDVIALTDIGVIGFLCPEQRILDVTGLTDRHIAKSGGGFLAKDYDVGYVLERAPRFLVLVLQAPGKAFERPARDTVFSSWSPIEQRIAGHPGFRRHYAAPRAAPPGADWAQALAAQLGAARVYEHPLPGARYLLAVFERH